jgi:hypothetical protein
MPETQSLAAEIDRRTTMRAAVLAALQSGPRDSRELNAICCRYGARLMELRREGWPIRSVAPRGGDTLWRYEMTGPREELVGVAEEEAIAAPAGTCPACGQPITTEDAP